MFSNSSRLSVTLYIMYIKDKAQMGFRWIQISAKQNSRENLKLLNSLASSHLDILKNNQQLPSLEYGNLGLVYLIV